MGAIPRPELEWLIAHGRLVHYEPGDMIARKGENANRLLIVFSGRFAIQVDRGAGSRRVLEWRGGDVSGVLPYSRMTSPPGDTVVEEAGESLELRGQIFPELIRECPNVTATLVHVMVDRARHFVSVDLHDEKMMSLGRLSAGLAHELNNPASAVARSSKLLEHELDAADAAARAFGATRLTDAQRRLVEEVRALCVSVPSTGATSAIDRADREDAIVTWLDRHAIDVPDAGMIADTGVTPDTLDRLAAALDPPALDAVVRWIATGYAARSLASEIERAAARIYQLVAAVKRFTFMDRSASPDLVDVVPGLTDTVTMLGAKARAKSAVVRVEAEPDVPRVLSSGGELNQVWTNLLDNALDAVPEGGEVTITVRRERNEVVVRVVDNGGGIPEDVLPRIFDPFFTTKPVGQGTGLGLEIAMRLVRRQQGDLTVESRPGRTVFRVSLPIPADATPAVS